MRSITYLLVKYVLVEKRCVVCFVAPALDRMSNSLQPTDGAVPRRHE